MLHVPPPKPSALKSVAAGNHVNNPALGYYKAREIVWEPRSSLGMLSVDGELVACGKVKHSQEF
jgi:hypothetical protein